MKNREEYLASIYTKRDIIIAKRKKKKQIAVSALCVVLCLCASAFAVPKIINKAPDTQSTSSTTAALTEIAEENALAEEPVHNSAITEAANSANKPHAYFEDGETEIIERLTNTEIYRETAETALEETYISNIKIFDSNGAQFGYIDSIDATHNCEEGEVSATKKSSVGLYKTDEIVEAACKNLTESEQKSLGNAEPNVTVSRKSSGEESYSIMFSSEETTVIITLNAENLELIDKKILANKTESISGARPPMTTAKPAYNPNE